MLYGSWELYLARGRQFDRYGYAASSLTVVPYIAMSILNLLAAIVEPQYPCVFLVKHGEDVAPDLRDEINSVMGGAVAVGTAPSTGADAVERDSPDLAGRTSTASDPIGQVSHERTIFGWVGNISVSDAPATNPAQIFRSRLNLRTKSLACFATVLAIGAYLAPYVVAFILTRFEKQQSTVHQRTWIVTWLVVEGVSGIYGILIRPKLYLRHWSGAYLLCCLGANLAPGIAVWVIVGKMILEGGICKIM